MIGKRLEVGMYVTIDPVCSRTASRHGLFYPKKIAMRGTIQRIDRIKNEDTIVIKAWHFHPDDLWLERVNYETLKEAPKKEYTPVLFNVENIL